MKGLFDLLDLQMRFATRLKDHGGGEVFAGTTDSDAFRLNIIRNAIRTHGLEVAIFGQHPDTHKPETYAQAFERCFGEPLDPNAKPKRGKKC